MGPSVSAASRTAACSAPASVTSQRRNQEVFPRPAQSACPAAEPWARKQGFTVPVEAWIAPRAEQIAQRLPGVEALRRLRPQAAAEFRAGRGGVRWPLLFFGVWARIHLEGASPVEALESVAGR